MFYSKDLLSRRSPLGAIWMVAHGKKLSRSKMAGIDVQDICEEIMHPEVPHSLRLQGILIGGVVVVYSRQQGFLLEDMQDMLRFVKDALNLATAVPTTGKATMQATRVKDTKARPAAIKFMPLDDETDLFGEDDLMMLEFGGLDPNNSLLPEKGIMLPGHTQRMLSLTPAERGEDDLADDDDLFAAPAMSLYNDSIGKPRSRSAATVAGSTRLGARSTAIGAGASTRMGASEKTRGVRTTGTTGTTGLGTGMLQQQEEMFMEVGAGEDYLELGADWGLPAVGSTQPRGAMTVTTDGSSPQGRIADRRNNQVAMPGPGTKTGSGTTTGLGTVGEDLEGLGDGMDVPMMETWQEGPDSLGPAEKDSPEVALSPESAERSVQAKRAAVEALRLQFLEHDSEVLTTEGGEEEVQENKAKARKAAGKRVCAANAQKRQGKGSVVVDAADEVLVKAREFRGWTMDTHALLSHRGQKRLLVGQSRLDYGKLVSGATMLADCLVGSSLQRMELGPSRMALPPLCPKLLKMYENKMKFILPPVQEQGKQCIKIPAKRARPAPVQGQDQDGIPFANGFMPDPTQEVFEEGGDWGTHEGEGLDMVADLPWEGGVEVERLRAASTTPGGSGNVALGEALGGLGSAAQRALAAGLRAPSSRATSGDTTTSGPLVGSVRKQRVSEDSFHLPSGSDLLLPGSGGGTKGMGGHTSRGPWAGSGATTGRATGSGSDLPLLRWGDGALEDLLPAPGSVGDVPFNPLWAMSSESDRGPSGGSGVNSLMASLGGVGRGTSSDPTKLSVPTGIRSGRAGRGGTSQPGGPSTDGMPLVETFEGLPTQVPPPPIANRSTVTVLKLVHQRLVQQENEGEADPAVSFFGLVQQLKRAEAVKLFIQVLVTQTAGYSRAEQLQPFGDIMIRRGHNLVA